MYNVMHLYNVICMTLYNVICMTLYNVMYMTGPGAEGTHVQMLTTRRWTETEEGRLQVYAIKYGSIGKHSSPSTKPDDIK